MPLPRSHRFLGRLPRGSCSPGVSPFLDFVAPPPSVALRPLQLQVSPPGAVWKLPRRRAIPEGRALFRAHRERTRRPIRSSRVRPRGLSPPRRVAPQRGCRSVAPCSGHGVHRVLRVGPPVLGRSRFRVILARLTVRTPLDEFPSPVAVPHHCGRCPLAVSTTSGPCSTDKSVVSVDHCWQADTLSIHGFCSPSKACSRHGSRRLGPIRCALRRRRPRCPPEAG